ncbi:MAG TPA: hypothetical protein VFX69_07230 [Steroidobacteraceae bacterium]|jgi:hypothetical protein|nr:hypothetical protein [Steroidobacteraceae bacterium]
MRLRDRIQPRYVDGADLPDDPPPPYRARLHIPEEMTPYGMEVTERDVVRGSVRIVYEIRCTCRRRWFQRTFERVQVCPRCGSAVLVERPD